jgi:hypothetical protein
MSNHFFSKRGRVAAAAAIIALTAGLTATAVAPAEAATFNYTSVSVCYVYTNGNPYTVTTYDQIWNGSTWVTGSAYAGTANGCRTWKVAPGVYERFFAYAIYPTSYSGGVYFQSGASGWIYGRAGVITSVAKQAVGEYSYGS